MLSLNGISAWIEVDGKELEQYGVEQNAGQSTVTCWIATQAGKGFTIVFRDNLTYRDHSLCSSLCLDGSHVHGMVLRPALTSGFGSLRSTRTVPQSDQVLSATSSRPFIFSKLDLTDEDEYLNQASTHLGEIQILIYRVHALESQLFRPVPGVLGHSKVHEHSKKAVTHCVAYGQEMKTSTRYNTRVEYLDGKIPCATFIFRYRDYSLLQANGVIPKPPSTKERAIVVGEVLDLTSGDDVKSEPVDDEIEIVDNTTWQRRVLASKRSNTTRNGKAGPAKKIKREHKFVPMGEVIDLT